MIPLITQKEVYCKILTIDLPVLRHFQHSFSCSFDKFYVLLRINDLAEIRLEAGATDKTAVNVILAEEFCRI